MMTATIIKTTTGSAIPIVTTITTGPITTIGIIEILCESIQYNYYRRFIRNLNLQKHFRTNETIMKFPKVEYTYFYQLNYALFLGNLVLERTIYFFCRVFFVPFLIILGPMNPTVFLNCTKSRFFLYCKYCF